MADERSKSGTMAAEHSALSSQQHGPSTHSTQAPAEISLSISAPPCLSTNISAPQPLIPNTPCPQLLNPRPLTPHLLVRRQPRSSSVLRAAGAGVGFAALACLALSSPSIGRSALRSSDTSSSSSPLGLSTSALSAASSTSEIESRGTGMGWPLKAGKQQVERVDPSSLNPDAQRTWGFGPKALAHTDQGQSTERWLNTGMYGSNPRVNGNIVGQLEDPPAAVSCQEDPISVECTGGFGGGMKATGGPMGTRVFWRRDNEFGLQPEMDGPVVIDPEMKEAFGYMYGYRGDRRTSFGVNY